MAGRGIERFEDIEAWQLAREAVRSVYGVTKHDAVRRDFGYVDQIRRAVVSIMNNIAEGYERGSNRDFVKFLFIARGSCGEVRSMLYVGLDQGYIDEIQFEEISILCVRVSKATWGLIKSLRRRANWVEGVGLQLFIWAMALQPLTRITFNRCNPCNL
jgi:four helix bundle protein